MSLTKSVCLAVAVALAWTAPPGLSPGRAAPKLERVKSATRARHHGAPGTGTGPSIGTDGTPTFDTAARFAIVVDYDSGAVLLDKNADQRMPTASMSKIMTAYQVYLYLKAGKAKLDDVLPVSKEAWKTGGSKMFVPYPGQVKVIDLLRGMIIQSGNDACVVLAEGLAGSTTAFVAQMNETAQKMGLTNSHFADVNGLPDPDHYMSPRDLVTLSEHLITDFPQFYRFEAEKEFTFNGIKQGNRNPLLYRPLGADGIKTGHTEEAGYGLVGSAVRNGRRVIFVISGLPGLNARAHESERILDWAYRAFDDVVVARKGVPIDNAPVWLGDKETVPVATERPVAITVPRGTHPKLKVTALYDGQIRAPVKAGQKVGVLHVAFGDAAPADYPLVTTAAVTKLSPVERAALGIAEYIWEQKH